MELPDTVGGWTLGVIEKLVAQGYLETDSYDFKAELASRDPNHARRLTATACAFANTGGGFLVFGVKDLGSEGKGGRIEGITISSDLAKDFGDKIQGASPNILFEFSNPPIAIKGSQKALYVVQVPLSSDRPHMTSEGLFYYRTNEGNKLMSYEQVKGSFLRFEERRTKVKLLLVELVTLEADAKELIVSASPPGQYSIITLETSVLNSILPDVYSMIQDDAQLVSELVQIRRLVSVMSSKIRGFLSQMTFPLSNPLAVIQDHNQYIQPQVRKLVLMIDGVVKKLENRYGLRRPF